jgi:DNA-directed RNA polymerase subunit RPC12/RpoP
MTNVCCRCGIYRADKHIDPAGPYAVCPECGHKQLFLQLPLLIVSGASGSGKSTLCSYLLGRLPQVVLLDADILWRPEFNRPGDNYRDFFNTWLRVSKNIAQSGRPVVLFNAGMGVPDNMEPCVERRYFTRLHYLALVCGDDELASRLRARPQWRQSGGQEFIESQLSFNRWFKEKGGSTQPPVELLDTTAISIDETAT